MYIDKYKKTLLLIDDIILNLKSDKLLFENDEFIMSVNNIKYLLTQKIFKVGIVGAIKAGKSSMLNSFIGRDLLPNENAPCTSSLIEIFYSNNECDNIKKYFMNGECEDIKADSNFTLEQAFHNDIKIARRNNEHDKIQKYSLNSPIYGIKNSVYGDIIKNFVLVDTPGLDEISISTFDVEYIRKISLKELRDSDALIVILDYQNFMSEINGKILKHIAKNENIINRSKNKIFFIINKIDLMNNKDDSISECIEKTKNIIKEYLPIIDNPNVYAFSAKQALFARMIKENIANQEILNEVDKLYGSKYTEKIEINGVLRSFKLEPSEYADKLLQESRIEIIEKEIFDFIFSNFAEENLEIGIEKLINVIDSIVSNLENDILSTYNKYNTSIDNFKKVQNILVEFKNNFVEILDIPKIFLGNLKDSISFKLDEISINLENMVGDMLPVKDTLESYDKNELVYKINVIENNIKESLNVTISKMNDHVYNECFNTQIKINESLNSAFSKFGKEFNKYTDEHIKFRFQIYNFDDICMSNVNFSNFNITETQSIIKEFGSFDSSTLSLGIAATSVAGSALGGIMGKTLPILETALGAVFGAGIGLAYMYIKKIKSRKVKERLVYSVDTKDFKCVFLESIKKVFEESKTEIFNNLDLLIDKSVYSVDKQLSHYVEKLDNKIERLMNNMKTNKDMQEEELDNIKNFKNKFLTIKEKFEDIRFKTIKIGTKTIEYNIKNQDELKNDNILVL